MSTENVKTIPSIFGAFTRGDVPAMLERTHPGFEWRPAITPGGLEPTVYHGHEGVQRWRNEVSESWEAMENFGLELNAVGDRRVLGLGRLRSRSRWSSAAIEHELAQFREPGRGRGRRAVGYLSHAEPLRAAGLEE